MNLLTGVRRSSLMNVLFSLILEGLMCGQRTGDRSIFRHSNILRQSIICMEFSWWALYISRFSKKILIKLCVFLPSASVLLIESGAIYENNWVLQEVNSPVHTRPPANRMVSKWSRAIPNRKSLGSYGKKTTLTESETVNELE